MEIDASDRPAGGFSIERYVESSRPLDLEGIQWEQSREYPITPEVVRAVTYFMDIEYQTINYLRDLLAAGAANDPEIAVFLSCWGYEEMFHGRALETFLKQYGIEVARERLAEVRRTVTWRERFEAFGAKLLAKYNRHFPALYLSWGASQEISTLMGYQGLGRRANNPILTEITRRIIMDESRHFSFYYHMARKHLSDPRAQRLTRWVLTHFWSPVGQGVKPDAEVRWIHRFIMEGEFGKSAIRHIDSIINKLPGLDSLNILDRYTTALGPA
ncbi:MAG: acyl-ACP desaturase [Nitrospirae bacterium]|nr:acyl-ACP desaturase [Nitrospirota bacterium]